MKITGFLDFESSKKVEEAREKIISQSNIQKEVIDIMLHSVGISTMNRPEFMINKEMEAKGIAIKFFEDVDAEEVQYEMTHYDEPILRLKGTKIFSEEKGHGFHYERVEIK